MTDNITLPRSVVERAITAIETNSFPGNYDRHYEAINSLRAALEQPQNHVPEAGNMAPAGWKLVPVEPTRDMLDFAEKCVPKTPRAQYIAMLSSAPQTTTDKESLTVDHPEPAYLLRDLAADIGVGEMDLIVAIRDAGLGDYSINMLLPARVCVAMCKRFSAVEQEPVAWIENVEGGIGYNPYHEAARKLPDGVRFDLYTHQQNLRCKSNQARLATLWGYVKAEPPKVEQEPASMAKVIGMDEYGPMLLWNRAWTDFPVGTKLYTRPQNLHCKSNQARLAALWGYVKADQQPQGEQKPMAWMVETDGGRHFIFRMQKPLLQKGDSLTPLYTRPKPRKPLTVEQIDGIIRDLDPSWLDTPTGFEEEFCRAIERAHEIGGEA